ncbi:NHL repeat containing protein [Oopsacas minuta]|uniref:NHL repeat containing protein n=1 Tax=Oopsacas minuta TaxID=111878 RepID=A0AAV7KKV5_9METZ|nr:NHL repeat containing protein [Oopsacas minuta]
MAEEFTISPKSILTPIKIIHKHLYGPDSIVCTETGGHIVHNSTLKSIYVLSSNEDLVCEIRDCILPWGLAVSTLHLFISDILGNVVKVYSHTGGNIYTIGTFGNSSGQFDNPTGLAFESISRHLYIADSGNNRIQLFDCEFHFVKVFCQGLCCPRDICIQNSSRIVILDESPYCIHIYSFSGDILVQFAKYGFDLFNPWSIAVSHYCIFVTDDESSSFLMFSFDGKCIGTFGGKGSGKGQFSDNSPTGLYFNNRNNMLYVSDKENNRIQIFNCSIP